MTKFQLYIPLFVGLLLVPAFAWADFQAGKEAYYRGDYETALKEFRALAEQGDVAGQYNLGVMYANGQGVPQDYQEAAKWYRLAAEQGHADAQSSLGGGGTTWGGGYRKIFKKRRNGFASLRSRGKRRPSSTWVLCIPSAKGCHRIIKKR